MIFNLIYNDFNKKVDININDKVGNIQQTLLNCCNLMIYNIENTELHIHNNTYILGSNDLKFSVLFSDFLDDFNKKYNECEEINDDLDEPDHEKVYTFYIYDRKRDERGNVIKNNIIIERFGIWFQENENEIYMNNLNNRHISSLSSSILRFPLNSILTNIFRNHNLNINSTQICNCEECMNRADSKEETEEIREDEFKTSTGIDIIDLIKEDMNEEESNNTDDAIEEDKAEEKPQEIPSTLRYGDNNIINPINSMIDIFDQYLRNTNYDNTYNNNDFEDLPDLIPIESTNNLYNYIEYSIPIMNNLNSYYYNQVFPEDVKICLSEEQFNNLDKVCYEELGEGHDNKCLICIDDFVIEDNIVKTKCCHLFHYDCLKKWLCDESNKCPVCRIEIDKGTPKNL
jgi:hypothetical protein